MSTKFKARRLGTTLKSDKSDGDSVILSPKCAESITDSDDEFDWSYTARCTREWSDDELLSYLCSKAFTIPSRDYSPSAPFVYVRTEDGVITTLPHGYRIPLMFIAKYQWETTTRALSLQNRQRWEAVRDEILHLSRLCHALFLEGRAKAESSGMEKGWRCIMFDRVLTRFYKGWPVSSPTKVKTFLSHFGRKEYEKDILKYDWRRWALKGFFRPSSAPTVHLTEEDINEGITAVDLKIRLSKIDNVWTLSTGRKKNSKWRPIKFMQATNCSSSELTDFDLSDDPNLDDNNEPSGISRLCPPFVVETPTKRGRELSGDDTNRSGKRAKLEEIIRSLSSQPCTPSALPDGSGDVFDDHDDLLPKFRVPRQTLFSNGWKQLSAMDDSERRRHREELEEEREETEIVPPCGFPTPQSIAVFVPLPPTPDYPMNDPFSSSTPNYPSVSEPSASNTQSLENALDIDIFTSSAQEKRLHTSLSVTSPESNLKGKQPEFSSTNLTASTTIGSTSRNPINSAYVSIPNYSKRMKSRTKLPPPAPTLESQLQPPNSFSSPVIGGENVSSSGMVVVDRPDVEIKCEDDLSFMVLRGGRRRYVPDRGKTLSQSQQSQNRGRASHAKRKKDKDKNKAVDTKGKRKVKMKHCVPSPSPSPSPSSLLLATASTSTPDNDDDDDGDGEQGEPTTTAAAPYDVPPHLDLMHAKTTDIELLVNTVDPKRMLIDNSLNGVSSLSSSSSSLCSLTPSILSASPVSLITALADVESEVQQQLNDQYRGLKARFLEFKDALGGIIGSLDVLESGGENLGPGGVDEGSSGQPDVVSQASRTKRKEKEKEVAMDVEMMGISESGGSIMPCYHDAAVGIDSLVKFKDVSVQADGEPTTHSVVTSTTIAVQTVDVSSAALPPETDQQQLSNVPNLGRTKSSPLIESKNDLLQFMNTTSLSTIVDNLVSVKMLSMMQSLVKSSVNGINNNKAKPVESTTANTTTESDSDVLRQPSPSSSSLSISASHSIDAYDNIVAILLDELKTIKEEARCREQAEKEDLLSMRQLHSAEVDALRRRLAYLESGVNSSLGRRENSEGRQWRDMHVDSLDLDRHRQQHQFLEDNSNHGTYFRQQYDDRSRTHHYYHLQQQNGLNRHSSSSSIVHPDGELTNTTTRATTDTNINTIPHTSYTPLSSKKSNSLRTIPAPAPASSSSRTTTDSSTINAISSLPTPNPTPSERNHSFGFSKNGMDLNDDIQTPLPLPIKSQRKHHMMALARAHFS